MQFLKVSRGRGSSMNVDAEENCAKGLIPGVAMQKSADLCGSVGLEVLTAHEHLVLHMLSYLRGHELARASAVCTCWQHLADTNLGLWQDALDRECKMVSDRIASCTADWPTPTTLRTEVALTPEDPGPCATVTDCKASPAPLKGPERQAAPRYTVPPPARGPAPCALGGGSTARLRELYRTSLRVSSLERVAWTGPVGRDTGNRRLAREQEGHACCSLFGGRIIAVINGWGQGGPHINNYINVMPTQTLPRSYLWQPVDELPGSNGLPHAVYGHSATAISDDTMAMYGGCVFGGYHGDVNCLRFITLHQTPGVRPRWPKYEAMRVKPETSGITPTSRAYHSATVVTMGGRRHLLMFGGIHEGYACCSLEALDMQTLEWKAPCVPGPAPTRRFGHSAAFLEEREKLVICGGSNGSDLLRNGADLTDVWVLSMGAAPGSQGSCSAEAAMAWSQPALKGPCADILGSHRDPGSLGRCHSMQRVGDHLIFFGGSKRLSNKVTIMDISDEDGWVCRTPDVGPADMAPGRRHAQVSCWTGRYLWIYGGYCNHDAMGDVHLLDLAADAHAPRQDTPATKIQLDSSSADSSSDECSSASDLDLSP